MTGLTPGTGAETRDDQLRNDVKTVITFLANSEIPAHWSILPDLERLHLAVLDLHGAAVVIDVTAVQTGPGLTGALQGLELHHRLTGRTQSGEIRVTQYLDHGIPLETDNSSDTPNYRADLVHHLHIDRVLGVQHCDEEDVVGRQLVIFPFKELPEVGIVVISSLKVCPRSLVRGTRAGPARSRAPVHCKVSLLTLRSGFRQDRLQKVSERLVDGCRT